jgi:hypothetical protein
MGISTGKKFSEKFLPVMASGLLSAIEVHNASQGTSHVNGVMEML